MSMLRISALFRSHGFRLHYSTVHGDSKAQLIVDYLTDSLQFSKQDAVSLSSKGNLTHLKSTLNSDSVINSFKNYGLNLTQIKDVVFSVPSILTCKAHKTLEPKLRVFQQLGLSGSDLVNLIKRNPDIFGFGLHTRIIPGLNLLKRLLGNDENVIKFINKSRWVSCTNNRMQRLSTNVSLLQNLGLSDDRIIKFMLSKPDNLMTPPNLFENRLKYVEQKLGVTPDLMTFIHALLVALHIPDAEVEKKMQIFRGFGWSDSDITLLFRTQPYCINKSQVQIREKLEFFMKGLGYTPSYLIRCNCFFTLSLSKRVMPRHKMLTVLKANKLVKDKLTFITVALYSELRFLGFLRGFEDRVPGLCEMYMDSVRRVS